MNLPDVPRETLRGVHIYGHIGISKNEIPIPCCFLAKTNAGDKIGLLQINKMNKEKNSDVTLVHSFAEQNYEARREDSASRSEAYLGKIISVCNQKGGTGKTTTAVNLAAALAECGRKLLIVDADPQGNATSGVGVNKNELKISVYDLFLGKVQAQEVIVKTAYPNLDIIPCNINLTGAEIELVGAISRETRLKKALKTIQDNYDFIFIDSPPSLGLLTLNTLVASDSIIIPIQCEFYALEGVSQLMNTINLVRDGLNPSLAIEGVLLTMADFRTNLTNEVIQEIKNYFKEKVYQAIIPRNIKLSEAPSFGKPITAYDSSSIGAKKYRELAKEILGDANPEHKQLYTNELENNRVEHNVQ